MTCNLEIGQLKKNAVLYRNENGKVVCVSKEEFLKEHDLKIKQLQLEWEQKNLQLEYKQKQFDEEWAKAKAEIEEYKKSIYDFINIMKGGN